MAEVIAIGEVMAELRLGSGLAPSLGFGGDTFNTAVYLSRLGCQTAYVTVLGQDDPFTNSIVALMEEERLDLSLVASAPNHLPGLYAIERDERGERRFFYWRSESPVRQFAARIDLGGLAARAATAELVYLSTITLAVVGESGRATLTELLPKGRVGLDLNYRAELWPSPAAAREAIERVAPLCGVVSVSTEDLQPLGLSDAPSRWARAGVEVVERHVDGSIAVHRPDQSPTRISGRPRLDAIDTTGAGDSFNAAYLARRLGGSVIEHAIAAGQKLAEVVVQHRGAIIPRSAMPTPAP